MTFQIPHTTLFWPVYLFLRHPLISAFKSKNRDGIDKNKYIFKCAKCNISFANIEDLEKHINSVHEEKKQFSGPLSELGNPISALVSPRYFVSNLLRNNIILQFIFEFQTN